MLTQPTGNTVVAEGLAEPQDAVLVTRNQIDAYLDPGQSSSLMDGFTVQGCEFKPYAGCQRQQSSVTDS